MRALVTGADGFIGSHLVPYLQSQGDDVVAWTRRDGSPDIRRPDDVAQFVEQANAEVIYHLAGQADVARSWRDPGESLSINAGGTANLFYALRKIGSDARVLLMSSAEVYGNVKPTSLPITEDAPFDPGSPYGVSKVAAEYAARQAWRSTGQPVVICRPFNHVGPNQTPNYVASAIGRKIVENERSGSTRLLVGDLSPTRDFVDVRDAVHAYRLVMEHGAPGNAYNVSTGIETQVKTLVELLISHSTTSQHLENDPALMRPARLLRIVGSTEKLAASTGWAPERDLVETAGAIIEDWRGRLTEQEKDAR